MSGIVSRTISFFLLFIFFLACPAFALPSLLNYCPNCDLIPDRSFVLQLQNYSYSAFDKQTVPPTKRSSMIPGFQVGLKKLELGLDIIADPRFSKPESGLYAGPTAFNFKYRILTQGSDTFSLVVGAYNLGTTHYNGFDFYEPSPYFTMCKSFGDLRLHLGYQWNLLGIQKLVEADGSKKINNGIICGFDYVLVKGKKPLTLLVDYFTGPLATVGVGASYPFNSHWSFGFSTYHPVRDHLPDSPASTLQLPKQLWLGLTYSHAL